VEVLHLSTITRFSIRSSGRDLAQVRRPKPKPVLTGLKKPELVALATEQGLDSSGTKADLLERLADG
jgi:hypothetical protein